tara:strand:+ start:261 stop:830 length:570 start_codon:yes stop_codon:yes gene_type:complete
MNIAKGHIYIIFCNVNPKIYYVGSTFNELKQRWRGHKKDYNAKKKNCSIYKYFYEYGIQNFTMKLIKSYDVYRENNKDAKHLRVYEQLWINKFRNSCNQIHSFNPLPKLIIRIHYEKNIKKLLEYYKKYYYDNKEKIKERKKNYREEIKKKYTCECGSILSIGKKARHIKTKKHQDYIKNNNNPTFAQY